jgi:hypothetical protein
MTDTRTTSAWASASLVCGIFGLLAGIPLPFIDYQNIAGATAGVGLIGPLLLGLLSALLALIASILGFIGLVRTSSGGLGGRGKAWMGTALGGLLLTVYVVVCGRTMFAWW